MDDVLVNSQDIFSKWLNSHEYHRDEDKRDFIKNLELTFTLTGIRSVFLMLLSEKTKAINNIAALINVIISKQNSIYFKIPAEQ